MRYATIGMLAISLLAMGCRGSARSQETGVKDSIFAIQRATAKVRDASEYEDALAAIESLRKETDTLKRLRDEFSAFGEPSRWERSRVRKHHSLWTSTNEEWEAAVAEMRRRLDDGQFPPDVRQRIEDAVAEFDQSRVASKTVIDPLWN